MGIRCIATSDGLFTRTGKPITACPHVSEHLKGFFVWNPDAVLDGELYNHSYKDDFNKIIHLVRKQNLTDEHLAESREMIQYHVYDAPVIGRWGQLTEEELFSERTSCWDANYKDIADLADEGVIVNLETT